MPKLNFNLSILILPFVFLSLQAQTAETKVGTATVSGRVTLKSESAQGVVVELQSEDAMRTRDRSPGLRLKTDENGRFRFTGVKAGRYILAAIAPGFITSVENTFGARAKAISLADGENVENQEIALKRGAVITGRVTDSNNKPLVEQQVRLTELDERGQPTRTPSMNPSTDSTDDRGVYRIYGLPAGRYLVSAGSAQEEAMMMMTVSRSYYQRTFHPDTTEQSKAKVVEVSEGFEATGIDIKFGELKKTYNVFGRVENADTGQPVAGISIIIRSLMDDGMRIGGLGPYGIQTDARGEFHLPGVLPGKYAAFGRGAQDSEFYSEPAIFEIGDEDATGVVVKMRRGASISGVAVIEGTNDPAILSKLPQIDITANVRTVELSSPVSFPAKPGPGGSFVIKGLKAGMARFSIFYRPDKNLFSILRIEHNGAAQREGVRINAGEQVTGVRIVIGHGSNTVRGQLRLTGGAMPEGATLLVSAIRTGADIVIERGGLVDAGGRFVIEGLMPGQYELKLAVSFPFVLTPEAKKLIERLGKQKQAVTVSGNQEAQVTFTVDLTPKEDRQ